MYKSYPSYECQYNTCEVSIVKPTRCNNVSNLFYFEVALYMFRTVFGPSSGVQDCTYSNRRLSKRQQYLFDKCLLLYLQTSTPNDGRKDLPKHLECHSKVKKKIH